MTEETSPEDSFPGIQPMTIRQKILNALFRAQMNSERVTLGSLNQRLADRKPEWFPVLQQMEQDGEVVATKNPDRRGSIWVHPSHVLHSDFSDEHRRECAFFSDIKYESVYGEPTTIAPEGRGVTIDFLSGQDAFDYMHEKLIEEIQDFGWISHKRAEKFLVKFPIQSQVFDHFWDRMTGLFFAERWYINSLTLIEGETEQYGLHTPQTLKQTPGTPVQMAVHEFIDTSNRQDYETAVNWLGQVESQGGFDYHIKSSHLLDIDNRLEDRRRIKAEHLETDVDDPFLLGIQLVREDRTDFIPVIREILKDDRRTVYEQDSYSTDDSVG